MAARGEIGSVEFVGTASIDYFLEEQTQCKRAFI
jgi:hypothetical protein